MPPEGRAGAPSALTRAPPFFRVRLALASRHARGEERSLTPLPARTSRRSSRPLTVVAILLAMFMSAMEATVVATAMPTVVADLHGIELYGWVGAIYMLAVTVTIPTWGKLADVWGRKPVLLLGLGLFLLG